MVPFDHLLDIFSDNIVITSSAAQIIGGDTLLYQYGHFESPTRHPQQQHCHCFHKSEDRMYLHY